MIHYHAKTYTAASVGGQIIAVTCEKWGCDYFYELARVVTGSASSPYGLTNSAASESAAKQARDDLGRRLESEAELVPCPRCEWINGDLVAGYRWGRYRKWGIFAALCAIIGTATSLIVAWFLSIGPAGDRGAVPYVLVGGPTIFLAIAGLVVRLRKFLRGRIRPNRDHPLPPILPPGCPPALLRDDATGELRVVAPRQRPGVEDDGWVEIQVGRQVLPQVCCQCLQPAGPESNQWQLVTTALKMSIPFCPPCGASFKKRQARGGCGMLTLVFGTVIGAFVAYGMDYFALSMLLGGVCAASLLRAFAVGGKQSPYQMRVADAARGVVHLRFRNAEYRRLLGSSAGGMDASPVS